VRFARPLSCIVVGLALACSSQRLPGVQATSGHDASVDAAGVDVDSLIGEDNAPADYMALPRFEPCEPSAGAAGALRAVTWNMKAARDAAIERVAEEIAAMAPDVIALQEVDVSARRTGETDQPRRLAELLGYGYAFAAALYWDGGVYGLALLSRLPFVSAQRHRLDSTDSSEPRIAFDVTLCYGGRPLRLIDVHADIVAEAAARQVSEAAELARPDVAGRVLLLGDFNQLRSGAGVAAASALGLVDVFAGDERPSFGDRRIDYVFAGAELARALVSADVWETSVSDHNALIADFAGAP
jgi:endonuclease/exonuclease/phosphatase family metal-dependent hydrolase